MGVLSLSHVSVVKCRSSEFNGMHPLLHETLGDSSRTSSGKFWRPKDQGAHSCALLSCHSHLSYEAQKPRVSADGGCQRYVLVGVQEKADGSVMFKFGTVDELLELERLAEQAILQPVQYFLEPLPEVSSESSSILPIERIPGKVMVLSRYERSGHASPSGSLSIGRQMEESAHSLKLADLIDWQLGRSSRSSLYFQRSWAEQMAPRSEESQSLPVENCVRAKYLLGPSTEDVVSAPGDTGLESMIEVSEQQQNDSLLVQGHDTAADYTAAVSSVTEEPVTLANLTTVEINKPKKSNMHLNRTAAIQLATRTQRRQHNRVAEPNRAQAKSKRPRISSAGRPFQLYEILLFNAPSKDLSGALNMKAVRKQCSQLAGVIDRIAIVLAGSGLAVILFILSRMLKINSTFDGGKVVALARGAGLIWLSAAVHNVRALVAGIPNDLSASKEKQHARELKMELKSLSVKALMLGACLLVQC